MAFSFNWAGLRVPQATFTKAVDDPEFGANLGRAARGYENRQAAKEYARKIDQFRKGRTAESSDNASRIAAIKAEIAKLESENANIDEMLGEVSGQTEQQVQPNGGSIYNVPGTDKQIEQYNNVIDNNGYITGDQYDAIMFDPEVADTARIKAMQKLIGVKDDGKWGPKSQLAFTNKYGSILM